MHETHGDIKKAPREIKRAHKEIIGKINSVGQKIQNIELQFNETQRVIDYLLAATDVSYPLTKFDWLLASIEATRRVDASKKFDMGEGMKLESDSLKEGETKKEETLSEMLSQVKKLLSDLEPIVLNSEARAKALNDERKHISERLAADDKDVVGLYHFLSNEFFSAQESVGSKKLKPLIASVIVGLYQGVSLEAAVMAARRESAKTELGEISQIRARCGKLISKGTGLEEKESRTPQEELHLANAQVGTGILKTVDLPILQPREANLRAFLERTAPKQ